MSGRCLRGRGDDGALLVEAAFVMPILMFLIMGFIEFAAVELHQSTVTNAARDGARVGILSWEDADDGPSGDNPGYWDNRTSQSTTCPTASASANWVKICDAVVQRMAGARVWQMYIECVASDALGSARACINLADGGEMTPGVDLVEVRVVSRYKTMTFVGKALLGANEDYEYTARMVVQ
jgi:hypothetical protein